MEPRHRKKAGRVKKRIEKNYNSRMNDTERSENWTSYKCKKVKLL